MSRLVTGLFYNRVEAERAIEKLRSQGIPADCIYLEAEVDPTEEMGAKGGEVRAAEVERRFAGRESGAIIGLALGVIAGAATGMMGEAIQQSVRLNPSSTTVPSALASPLLATILGALIGLCVGAVIGWIIDSTLNQMGAGPALPSEETLVTIRATEGDENHMYSALWNAGARRLHVAERSGI